MEKVFHPTMKSSTVEQTDPEALTLCATFLHEIGWFTQQNGFEGAACRVKWWAENHPDMFLKACANGLTVILDAVN